MGKALWLLGLGLDGRLEVSLPAPISPENFKSYKKEFVRKMCFESGVNSDIRSLIITLSMCICLVFVMHLSSEASSIFYKSVHINRLYRLYSHEPLRGVVRKIFIA